MGRLFTISVVAGEPNLLDVGSCYCWFVIVSDSAKDNLDIAITSI